MSGWTVRRWKPVGKVIVTAPMGNSSIGAGFSEQRLLSGSDEIVLASDYDALRTQARELAEALADNRELLCPYYYGTEQRAAWLLQDEAYQRAQAVLKDGR